MALTQVNFCPQCGNPLVTEQRFGKPHRVCASCGWIYFADPKVAAAVLVEQEGRVLLVRRVNEPFRGLWTLPAGFVDAEEDPARAAARECLEETGLVIRVTRTLEVVAGREHPRGADFVIVYAAEVESGVLHAADDADKAGWFEMSDLPPLAFLATKRILKQE
ncbi:MAG TPA: NUDIX hydrolase [Anaerolineales bacterium]|nr:NUDIX hydrolase [Anaerolineales bacterium]